MILNPYNSTSSGAYRNSSSSSAGAEVVGVAFIDSSSATLIPDVPPPPLPPAPSSPSPDEAIVTVVLFRELSLVPSLPNTEQFHTSPTDVFPEVSKFLLKLWI